MGTNYLAVIEKSRRSAFGVWFPDVKGCFSAGDAFDLAVANAAQALRQHVEALESRGDARPVQRQTDAILRDVEVKQAIAKGGVIVAVPLLADAGRTVRINISLNAGLVASIDDAAEARGLTRSAFIAQAAREKIYGA